MNDQQEETVLVTSRIEDFLPPYRSRTPGSKTGRCSICKKPVSIAPTSFSDVANGARPVCTHCISKQAVEEGISIENMNRASRDRGYPITLEEMEVSFRILFREAGNTPR